MTEADESAHESADAPSEAAAIPEATSRAEAMALAQEAEAEAAEAEAMAAAARARARAARLRREALTLAEDAEDYGDAAAAAADAAAVDDDYQDYDETVEYYDEEDGEEYDEAADEAYDGDHEAAPEPVTGPDSWRRRLPSLAATSKMAAVILIACFACFSVYAVLQHRDSVRYQQRQGAFIAGAKQLVTNMISLDYHRAQADVQRVIDGATGEFKDDFQSRAKDFISVVEQSKAVTEGTVNGAAVESMNGNSAVVLVSATSHVTNSPPGQDQPPRMWRLRVTIADVGGQYKMSKVEYVA